MEPSGLTSDSLLEQNPVPTDTGSLPEDFVPGIVTVNNMCDRDSDGDTERRSVRPPTRSIDIDDLSATDEASPSKAEDHSTEDSDKEIVSDATIDQMTIEDLRELTKRILRVAKESENKRDLSEMEALIQRQQHQRRNNNDGDPPESKITESTSADTPNASPAALDPSHPDSVLSLPPLLRCARSHDDDSIDEPRLLLRRQSFDTPSTNQPASPTLRTSNQKASAAAAAARMATAATIPEGANESSENSSSREKSRSFRGSGKRQLVILCSREPGTEKERKDQDLAMILCKNMGIIPCVIVSELSSENQTPSQEEQLLINCISEATGSENSGSDTHPYPQFFVRNILQELDSDQRQAMIDYQGDYDTMAELYRTGRFGPKSLEVTVPRRNDNMLDSYIRDTTDPESSRAAIRRGSGSVGEPSMSSPRRTISLNSASEPPAELHHADSYHGNSVVSNPEDSNDDSGLNKAANNNSSGQLSFHNNDSGLNKASSFQGSSAANSSGSYHLSLGGSNNDSSNHNSYSLHNSQNGEASYSHLDGMNQPKSNQSNSNSSNFGEMSLGDDLRMIFDIEQEVGAIPAVDEVNPTAPARGPAGMAAVPTITEDEEDEEEEEDDNDEMDTGGEEEEAEELNNSVLSSASMTILPSGTILKRETVTLKPRSHRPQVEPPGSIASVGGTSRYLDQARGSLKTPSSPEKSSSVFKAVEKKTKKIPNPYYALAAYNGGVATGGNDSQRSEIDPAGSEIDPPTRASPKPTGPPDPDETTTPEKITLEPTDVPERKEEKESHREYLAWEKKFVGTGACYLVFHSDQDELNIHYSETPMPNSVGVWTSPDIENFKKTQGLSECELIGTCATDVTQNVKYYCQAWCQFVKAAKIMDATVTALEGVGMPVEFYLYEKGRTIQVSASDGEAIFDTKSADAIACVPRGCDFPASAIVGKKWGKVAKKLGAVALFRSLSVKKYREIEDESSSANAPGMIKEISVPVSSPSREKRNDGGARDDSHKTPPSSKGSIKTKGSANSPTKYLPSISPMTNSPKRSGVMMETEAISTLTMPASCPDEAACYLVYDPDSSGRLVEHYSSTSVDSAIGRWIPTSGKKIAPFKFKRNHGRNVLIGNCSGGVQGRKNYYSGWCQFVRSAKNMNGSVILWDPAEGQKGLKVDVFLYYDDNRPYHQTVRMDEGTAYTTDQVLAVACVPKETPFFETMTVDLLMWLAEGSKHGCSSKM